MPFRQTAVAGAPALALRGAALEVVVVPTESGRIARMRRPDGREWLRDHGWREVLEAATADHRPGAATDLLSAVPWANSVYEHAAGVTLASSVELTGDALRYERELTIDPVEPVVRLRYRLRHAGGEALWWVWGPDVRWTVQPGTSLHVPGLHQVRVVAVEGRDDLDEGDIAAWPGAVGGDAARFQMPPALPWSIECVGDLGPTGRVSLIDPRRNERCELHTDPSRVPHVSIALIAGGDDHAAGIAVAPRLGVPAELADAVRLGTAASIAPGEERVWGVEIRLIDPEQDDPAA